MVLYAAVPDFYAEVERSTDPTLRERPVVVGGDPRKRGTVQAASADARAAGVRVGMSVIEALERCPQARARRTDVRRYREVAQRLRACARGLVRRVEPAGLDALFLDASERPGGARELAHALRSRVAEELSLPLQVGVAPVKFLAKLAAEHPGGAEVLELGPGDVRGFLDPLPVSALPGVGPRTVERLAQLSVHTVAELLAVGRAPIEEALGNHGLAILGYARGDDPSTVRAAATPRSVSQEVTLEAAESDRAALGERLAELARRLEGALLREGLATRRLTLRVRFADREVSSRTRSVSQPLADQAGLARLAEELLDRSQARSRPVRGLALSATALVRGRRDDAQLDLFAPPRARSGSGRDA